VKISTEDTYMTYFVLDGRWDGDGAGNTVEENSSVFSLIRMH